MKIVRCTRFLSWILVLWAVIMEKLLDKIMEIMENTVHVHTLLSFVLIPWANYEEKSDISNKLWNNQSCQIHTIPVFKEFSKAGH